MTVPAEPILIGSHSVLLKFFAMPRNADDPRRIEGTLTLVGPEGVLTLDALIGPQGNPGQPSPIIRPQWGSSVTEPDDLPDVSTLDWTDDGRAWFIAGQWHVYSDVINDYHVIEGSIPGPQGITPDISVSAEGIEAPDPVVYGPIEVVESGTSTSPNFHIKIPMVPGPEGPASAIRLASDYDETDPPEDGASLVWDDDNEKWKPGQPTLFAPKKYTIPHTSFTAYNGSNGRRLLASLNIEPQDFDWYPDVIGHVATKRGPFSSAQVEMEVRIGITNASTGEQEPLCGLGPYDPSVALLDSVTQIHILPHFSDPGFPGRALSPDSEEGRCLEGVAYTVYVFGHRKGGSGNWEALVHDAQLRLNIEPVI
jgi:hypothetical protein